MECWAVAEVARVGPEEGLEQVLEVGGGWVVEDTLVPLTGMVIPGLLSNSILFCRLFTITDRCKKRVFKKRTIKVLRKLFFDSVLGPPCLVRHT